MHLTCKLRNVAYIITYMFEICHLVIIFTGQSGFNSTLRARNKEFHTPPLKAREACYFQFDP